MWCIWSNRFCLYTYRLYWEGDRENPGTNFFFLLRFILLPYKVYWDSCSYFYQFTYLDSYALSTKRCNSLYPKFVWTIWTWFPVPGLSPGVSKNRLEIHRIYRPILSKRLYQSVSSLLQYNGCPQKQFILKVLDKHKNKILVLPVCKCIVAPRRALILNFYPKFVRIFVTSILNQEPSLFGFCGKGVLVHSVLN